MNDSELKYCERCGTRAESPDQRFCTKCGARIDERAEENVFDYVERDRIQTENRPLTMRWYRFLVSFALLFGAVMNAMNSIGYISGNYLLASDIKPDEFYSEYGAAMKGIDVAYGVILIGTAFYLFMTRYRLIRFKKNSPALLLTYYVINCVLMIFYEVATCVIAKVSIDYTVLGMFVLVGAVTVCLNAVYFKKRMHLFVN